MQEINFTGNATLLYKSAFGVVAIKVRSFRGNVQEYAQYKDAVRIQYLEQRKRTPKASIHGYEPWFVLVDGHDVPSPESATVQCGENATITRHSSFSEEWTNEANVYVEKLVKLGYNVLWDCRDHKPSNKF